MVSRGRYRDKDTLWRVCAFLVSRAVYLKMKVRLWKEEMRANSIMRAFSIALAAAGLVTGCDKTPTGPTPGPPSVIADPARPTPATPVEPGIRSIEIEGPQVVHVGQTVQFSLIAQMTDGSRRDLTSDAQWVFGGTPLSEHGRVTGLERGEIRVGASYQRSYRPQKIVIVVPAGTHRLMGQVNDANVPVEGARVEVTGGVGAGLSTFTDSEGIYRLYGVSGETRFRVTKDGYQSAVPTVVVSDHQRYDVWLTLLQPRLELSGNYILTITAEDHCVGLGENQLPEEARVRTYQAAVRQDASRLQVTLTGATFLARSDVVGRVDPRGVTLYFPWDNGKEQPVLEQLENWRYLVSGNVVAAGSADRFTGTLFGQISVFEMGSIFQTPIASCFSERHQFVLWR